MTEVELHPLPAFLPPNARILMLGSFPPPKSRWKMDFFYPNLQNDMWRILGLVFFKDPYFFLAEDKKSFNEIAIRAFASTQGIALWDTAMEIIRQKGNASDKFLEVVKAIDLEAVLKQIPYCCAIAITGQKAMDTLQIVLNKKIDPTVGCFSETTYQNRTLKIFRMPSSSRAYPKPLEDKARIYKSMFLELGFDLEL